MYMLSSCRDIEFLSLKMN